RGQELLADLPRARRLRRREAVRRARIARSTRADRGRPAGRRDRDGSQRAVRPDAGAGRGAELLGPGADRMLHIVNKSPTDGDALDTALRLSGSGALLLIEDGVYAATRGNPAESRIRSALERQKIYVLAPDLEARGMADRLT